MSNPVLKLKNEVDPDDVLISRRLYDLMLIYGKDAVENEVYFEQLSTIQLRRHINNLIITYSIEAVFLNWEIISGVKNEQH